MMKENMLTIFGVRLKLYPVRILYGAQLPHIIPL